MTDEQWTLEELTLSAEERWRFEARATVATVINDAYMAKTGQLIADDRWLEEVTAKIAEVMWAAESSRRDWAAEAARLQAELDDYTQPATWDEPHPFKDNGYGDPELGAPGNCDTCGRIQDEPEHEPPFGPLHLRPAANAPCACISDDQATHLGPRFSRPVCAVHPEGGQCPAQESGEADDCLCDDKAACGERYAQRWHPGMGRTAVEGGA